MHRNIIARVQSRGGLEFFTVLRLIDNNYCQTPVINCSFQGFFLVLKNSVTCIKCLGRRWTPISPVCLNFLIFFPGPIIEEKKVCHYDVYIRDCKFTRMHLEKRAAFRFSCVQLEILLYFPAVESACLPVIKVMKTLRI